MCGLAIRPSSSRSAITLRIVAGDSSRPDGARQRARADRLAVGDVALDQGFQQHLGTVVEHGVQGLARDFNDVICAMTSLFRAGRPDRQIPRRGSAGRGGVDAAPRSKTSRSSWRRQGCEVSLERDTAASTGIDGYPRAGRRRPSAPHATSGLVVGGDGTMLGIGRQLARHGMPLIGINQGRLGFITDIPLDDYRARAGARCWPASTRKTSAP